MKVSEQEIRIELREQTPCVGPEMAAAGSTVTAHRVLDCGCRLGEGILFDDRTSSVLWTDIYGKRLHRLQIIHEDDEESSSLKQLKDGAETSRTAVPDGGTIVGLTGVASSLTAVHSVYIVPKQLCSFGLLEHHQQPQQPSIGDTSRTEASLPSLSSFSLPLLCAWKDGFSIFDVASGREVVGASRGPDVRPNRGDTRLNDGRVDPLGTKYVCGGFYGDVEENHEKVFAVGWDARAEGVLVHEAVVERIQTTNSINWTRDGKRMYLADSAAKMIWTYEYEPGTSRLSDRQVLCSYSVHQQFVPDGSCVDAEGFLWNAVWCHGEDSGKVHRIHPATGEVVLTVRIPDCVSQVSCCCFGGKKLDILFITTACEGRDKATQPHAGDLYAVKLPGVRGRHESRFKLRKLA